MCLDISFKIEKTEDSLYDYLPHLKIDPQLSVDFENISHIQAHNRPKTKIIYTNAEGVPYLTLMRWGVISKYMLKDAATFMKYANNSYNIRAERIFDPKSSWYKIRTHHCLIDTSGIYEHRSIKGWKHKVPYFVRLANNKRMLIPALFNFIELNEDDIKRIKVTNDKNLIEAVNKIVDLDTGEITGTYGMITTEANDVMKKIHNDGPNRHRMPLFFQPEQAIRWIDPLLSEVDMKEMLAYEIPSEELQAEPVYTIRTTKSRPDEKEKYERFDWPGLPPLGIDESQSLLF